jgi:GINS complex subunit 2
MISFTASDSEFFAEETIVTITSAIDHPIFYFISGNFGPLVAGLPCELPLWLAINLRRKQKCTIEIPQWMSVESLENFVEKERSEENFEQLPFHYLEIAHLLLNFAKEEIHMYDRVCALVQDLENIRKDRCRLGMLQNASTVRQGERIFVSKWQNICSMEIHSFETFLTESMDMFFKLTETSNTSSQENRSSSVFLRQQSDHQTIVSSEGPINLTNNDRRQSKLRRFKK